MEWRSLKEFPNYQFSDTGLVKKRDKYVTVSLSNGYARITLSNDFAKKRVSIHHVIAELFIGPRPDGQLVRHLDDDRENNHVSNLAYGTQADNIADAIRNGKIKRGDEHHSRLNPEHMSNGDEHWSRKNPEKVARGNKHWTKVNPKKNNLSKLTEEEVNEIRNTKDHYGCMRKLAEKFKVDRSTISRIRNGVTWQK